MHKLSLFATQWVVQWQMSSEEFGLTFVHKKGRKNCVADALCQMPTNDTGDARDMMHQGNLSLNVHEQCLSLMNKIVTHFNLKQLLVVSLLTMTSWIHLQQSLVNLCFWKLAHTALFIMPPVASIALLLRMTCYLPLSNGVITSGHMPKVLLNLKLLHDSISGMLACTLKFFSG